MDFLKTLNSVWSVAFICLFLLNLTNSYQNKDGTLLQEITIPASQNVKSTEDLSFLIGEWEVERIYSPKSDQPRIMNGTLVCNYTMDKQFIKCTYEMQRPGKIRGLDVVYFNYNTIYELYESMWLSSTWPIKGILQGQLVRKAESLSLHTAGQFAIQDGIMEYVRDSLIAGTSSKEKKSFFRKTYIRTSKDPDGYWLHHMNEKVSAVKG